MDVIEEGFKQYWSHSQSLRHRTSNQPPAGPHAAITTFWTWKSNQFSTHFIVHRPSLYLTGVAVNSLQDITPKSSCITPAALTFSTRPCPCRKQSDWLCRICLWYVSHRAAPCGLLIFSMSESSSDEDFSPSPSQGLSRSWPVCRSQDPLGVSFLPFLKMHTRNQSHQRC